MIPVRLSQIEIPENDPFKFDLLSRKHSVEVLTQFVELSQPPYVMALDSPWGTGKTTFLKMWLQSLSNRGFTTLYFNAWENDFSDDPLIPIMVQFDSYVEDSQTSGRVTNKAKKYLKEAKKCGARLAKTAIPTVVKIATHGIVDIEKFTGDSLAELSEKIVTGEIQAHKHDKKNLIEFRDNLTNLVSTLGAQDKDGKSKPLLFAIDELDRCKPTFAIKVLERIKHIFDINNVIFVLALDKDQLAHSLRSIYGIGMDVDGYLRRFLDVDYRLPRVNQKGFVIEILQKFGLVEKLDNGGGDVAYIGNLLEELFRFFGFSLRNEEQCIARLSTAYYTISKDHRLNPALLAILVVLRMQNLRLYESFISGESGVEDFLRHFEDQPRGKAFVDGGDGIKIEGLLAMARGDQSVLTALQLKYEKKIKDTSLPLIDQEIAQRKFQAISYWKNSPSLFFNQLPSLARAIEIAENFTG
jgi:hypothetical protein